MRIMLIKLFKVFCLFLFLATLHGICDLSSPARDKPMPPPMEAHILNHQTTREVP